MGIQWYLKQFRKDIGRFLQEIRCQHRVAPRFLLFAEIPGLRHRDHTLRVLWVPWCFYTKSGDVWGIFATSVFSSEKQFNQIPVIPVEHLQNGTVELPSQPVSIEALPLRLSGDRSMRQVLRTSIWRAMARQRWKWWKCVFFFYV
jgi:hypothetical protein